MGKFAQLKGQPGDSVPGSVVCSLQPEVEAPLVDKHKCTQLA